MNSTHLNKILVIIAPVLLTPCCSPLSLSHTLELKFFSIFFSNTMMSVNLFLTLCLRLSFTHKVCNYTEEIIIICARNSFVVERERETTTRCKREKKYGKNFAPRKNYCAHRDTRHYCPCVRERVSALDSGFWLLLLKFNKKISISNAVLWSSASCFVFVLFFFLTVFL